MKIKRYKEFLENAESTSVSGMGSVVSAQPGTLPGTTGTEGSGDIGFTFKKERRKKGGPSEVTDLRDLEDTKEINKIEDIKESFKRNPAYNDETKDNIYDCLSELLDSGFQVVMIDYDSKRMSMDLDDEETGYFDDEQLKIHINKVINKNWTGNIEVEYEFNKEVSKLKDITTLRSTSKSLEDDEQKIVEILEDICLKMINVLDYDSGKFKVSWSIIGSAMPLNKNRDINCNITITMSNIFKYQ